MDWSIEELTHEPDFVRRGRGFTSLVPYVINEAIRDDRGAAPCIFRAKGEEESAEIALSFLGMHRQDLGKDVIDEIEARLAQSDIDSATVYVSRLSVSYEQQSVDSPSDYDLGTASYILDKVCRFAGSYGGTVSPDISAAVFRRWDGTVCIQIFFSVVFTDEQDTSNASSWLLSSFLELINKIRGYQEDGFVEYAVGFSG